MLQTLNPTTIVTMGMSNCITNNIVPVTTMNLIRLPSSEAAARAGAPAEGAAEAEETAPASAAADRAAEEAEKYQENHNRLVNMQMWHKSRDATAPIKGLAMEAVKAKAADGIMKGKVVKATKAMGATKAVKAMKAMQAKPTEAASGKAMKALKAEFKVKAASKVADGKAMKAMNALKPMQATAAVPGKAADMKATKAEAAASIKGVDCAWCMDRLQRVFGSGRDRRRGNGPLLGMCHLCRGVELAKMENELAELEKEDEEAARLVS
jgi:hypothetical protein